MQPQPPMPRWLWMIPVGIALLRSLPWLASRALGAETPDEVLLDMGFIPKDTLQYLAFARQTAHAIQHALNPAEGVLPQGEVVARLHLETHGLQQPRVRRRRGGMSFVNDEAIGVIP